MPKPKNRKCVRCGKGRNPTRYVGKRGRICDTCRKQGRSEAARNRRLTESYSLEPDEWEAILALCRYRCGGCGEPRSYRLHVDHSHKIEAAEGIRASIRGPLCRRCNKMLRDCRDSIPVLMGLVEYLMDPPAQKVLHARH